MKEVSVVKIAKTETGGLIIMIWEMTSKKLHGINYKK
jgi:hypothetical protein